MLPFVFDIYLFDELELHPLDLLLQGFDLAVCQRPLFSILEAVFDSLEICLEIADFLGALHGCQVEHVVVELQVVGPLYLPGVKRVFVVDGQSLHEFPLVIIEEVALLVSQKITQCGKVIFSEEAHDLVEGRVFVIVEFG